MNNQSTNSKKMKAKLNPHETKNIRENSRQEKPQREKGTSLSSTIFNNKYNSIIQKVKKPFDELQDLNI